MQAKVLFQVRWEQEKDWGIIMLQIALDSSNLFLFKDSFLLFSLLLGPPFLSLVAKLPTADRPMELQVQTEASIRVSKCCRLAIV